VLELHFLKTRTPQKCQPSVHEVGLGVASFRSATPPKNVLLVFRVPLALLRATGVRFARRVSVSGIGSCTDARRSVAQRISAFGKNQPIMWFPFSAPDRSWAEVLGNERPNGPNRARSVSWRRAKSPRVGAHSRIGVESGTRRGYLMILQNGDMQTVISTLIVPRLYQMKMEHVVMAAELAVLKESLVPRFGG
jgi:hypothetical protein